MHQHIGTSKALALAGLSVNQWDYLLPMFKGAPATKMGKARRFDVPDLIVLFVVTHYLRLGVSCDLTGRIATEARKLLARHCDADTLWVTLDQDERPVRVTATEPTDQQRHAFPVAELRVEIERYMAALQ